MTVERVLSLRELNRATLERQLLLERASVSPLEAIQRVAGLQGQLANPPYMGLWSRLKAFQRTEFTELLERRQVVRTSMMRRTLHVTSAEDYLAFRPALQALHSRHLVTYLDKQHISAKAFTHLVAEMQAYVREKPRTNGELRSKIAGLFPGGDERLLYIVRIALPLIQVFPGGAWGVGGSPAYAEAEPWLGNAFVSPQAGLRTLLLSYLAAFGPASVKDMQAWSGLSRLQLVVDELRAELVILRDEQGRELFDLPGAPLPSADTSAPVRFIPDFDNLVLAYDQRQRIIADAYRPFVFPGLSSVFPTFLVDGFVSGVWHIERLGNRARLLIQPFEPLSHEACRSLREEGTQLMQWAADKISDFEIEIVPYGERGCKQNMWGKL